MDYLHNLSFIGAFLGGILASLNPCIYPIIPITIGIIGGKAHRSRLKSFFLSLVYVLGIAITYSTLGVISALTGKFLGEITTKPIVYLFVGNICILLGLSMFNIFSLPSLGFFPKIKGGAFIETFFLGLFSGLVISPCITPILGGLLSYTATRQNVLLAGSLLFTFSMGMGLLLIFIGTFTGFVTLIPKPGPWMEGIKKFFAFLLIGAGEYFIFLGGRNAF